MNRERRPPLPFRPRLFLFRALAGIFLMEGFLLAYAFQYCSKPDPAAPREPFHERCPRLGQRTESAIELALATVLSLLAGKSGAAAEEIQTRRGKREEEDGSD